MEVITSADSFTILLNKILKEELSIKGFKAEYLILNDDSTDYSERRNKLKDVGYCIHGQPDFETPSILFSICTHQGQWYFGKLIKSNTDWYNHKKKPRSFSNSIGMNIAKTLVSVATQGDKSKLILDACCGVGTVMLEGCFSGFKIEGCDINENACNHTLANLDHYNYSAPVFCMDINQITQKYDAIIVDLPYNLYSYSNDAAITNIIKSVVELSTRILIVSTSNMKESLQQFGLKIIDECRVGKRGKSTFERTIWVCEKT